MAGKPVRSAVVGASTLLGKELLSEIADSAAATWDLDLLDEGEDAEGRVTSAGDEAMVTHTLSPEAFAGLDLVFFAAGRDVTEEYLQAALQSGASVVDLSGATADREGFLLGSRWLDHASQPDLMTQGVTIPHPASLLLSVAAARLRAQLGRVTVVATVLEPASQAGSAGVDELHQQTVSLLSFQELPKSVYDAQVAFNLLADTGSASSAPLQAVRKRVQTETAALLRNSGEGSLAVNVLQAPVFHGTVLSAYCVAEHSILPEAVTKALEGEPFADTPDQPPSNQMAVESGELLLRVEGDPGGGVWLTMAADNLRLTARVALAAAQLLVALRPGVVVQ